MYFLVYRFQVLSFLQSTQMNQQVFSVRLKMNTEGTVIY
jgi:hypothetical protein